MIYETINGYEYYLLTGLEFAGIIIGSLLLGIFLCCLYLFVVNLENKRHEYMKSLNDKEYKKYNEYLIKVR